MHTHVNSPFKTYEALFSGESKKALDSGIRNSVIQCGVGLKTDGLKDKIFTIDSSLLPFSPALNISFLTCFLALYIYIKIRGKFVPW